MRTPFMTASLLKRQRTALLLLIGSLSWLLSACDKPSVAQEAPPPSEVSVAEVVVRNIIPWEEFTGRIEAQEVVQIRPRVGGVIEEIKYREGQMVKKGDLLFVIDKQPFQAELNRAEAELARSQAQAELTHAEISRAKNLVKRKLLSNEEYDQRVAADNQARANVRSARATVELARLNLAYTEIRAPIDGHTGRALVTRGNLVSSSTAPTPDLLTTILSVDPVYVLFDSDELTYLNYLVNAEQAEEGGKREKRQVFVGIGNEAGFPREGYIDFINNRIDPQTGTIKLRAVVDNKDHRLTPGLFARVKLLAPSAIESILINERAILTDQDRKYVYVLNEKNQAMRRDVTVGRSIEGMRIVNEGLKPGEKIVVHGIQKVFFPGMQVKPHVIGMNDPAATPTAPSATAAEH